MKNFISMGDLNKKEIEQLFAAARQMQDKTLPPGGRTAALLFNMPSTRTLVSFEAALEQLGIGSSHLDYVFTQMVRGEEMKDTAQALSQYVCTIVARLNDHDLLRALAQHSKVPVINAATPVEHPCQVLADLYTLYSHGLLKSDKKFVFLGDPTSPVVNSLLLAAGTFDLSLTLVVPKGYRPLDVYAKKVKRLAVVHTLDALENADAVYTHSWIHETPAQESPERLRDFLPYQVNALALQKAPRAVVMHPLPAFRGMEITSEVLDGTQCLALEQSRNRLYVQKALLRMLLSL